MASDPLGGGEKGVAVQPWNQSAITNSTTPAEAFPPGEYLRDEFVERGWTVPEFARTIGWPVPTVTSILDGEREISASVARDLADVLGTTPQVWLNLQAAWHRSRSDRRPTG